MMRKFIFFLLFVPIFTLFAKEVVLTEGINSSEFLHTKQQSQNLSSYISFLYKTILQRESDQEGLEYWEKAILNKEKSPKEMILDFFSSDEFLSKNVDDKEFIKTAYQAIFQREANDGEITYWLPLLQNGVKREEMLNILMASDEFKDKISSLIDSSQKDLVPAASDENSTDTGKIDISKDKLDIDEELSVTLMPAVSNPPYRYELDWGDGDDLDYGYFSKDSNETVLKHSYQNSGKYTIIATIFDHDGKIKEITKEITVNSEEDDNKAKDLINTLLYISVCKDHSDKTICKILDILLK